MGAHGGWTPPCTWGAAQSGPAPNSVRQPPQGLAIRLSDCKPYMRGQLWDLDRWGQHGGWLCKAHVPGLGGVARLQAEQCVAWDVLAGISGAVKGHLCAGKGKKVCPPPGSAVVQQDDTACPVAALHWPALLDTRHTHLMVPSVHVLVGALACRQAPVTHAHGRCTRRSGAQRQPAPGRRVPGL